MLLRTDIFKGDIEELFRIQDRLERHLGRWENNHPEFSHNSLILFGKASYSLKIELHEEQQYTSYN